MVCYDRGPNRRPSVENPSVFLNGFSPMTRSSWIGRRAPRVRYAAPSGPTIEVFWQGFSQLGIWSKPAGAPFLCIEPWHGFVSPLDFDGEFSEKPGLIHIAPAEALNLAVPYSF